MDIMQIIQSPIVTKALLTLITFIGGYLATYLRKILKTIRYMELNQIAMDYALEQSLKNGYAKHRQEKLEQLQKRDKFIGKTI